MAFPLGNKPLPGYPQPSGEKYQVIFDHPGPASYTQLTAGTTPTGGDKISASGGGLNFGGFDKVDGGYDSTGQISASVIPLGSGYGNATPSVIVKYVSLVTATLGGQAQTAGSEIAATTNLSTFSWRMQAIAV